ncbi:zinc finger protein CONSTANS-LIKE 1-like protein [Tanacetum coccineum]|uniref:Zinc finger protein CONSTANS-LIKE 1-like protein n=1 Tax=Tanacetum coccineum TaxID=301880 RepID=A0ABQ5F787_9ASTR
MKKCELCKSTATIHCDSDRANLCWTCDANVHSANFLVAKHLRNLLCHVCHSPTPWAASGEKLSSSTVSVCGTCVAKGVTTNDDKEEKVGCSDGTSCTDGFVIDNKAMPPAASSSSSEEVFKGDKGVSMNRKRRNVVPDLNSEILEESEGVQIVLDLAAFFFRIISSTLSIAKNGRQKLQPFSAADLIWLLDILEEFEVIGLILGDFEKSEGAWYGLEFYGVLSWDYI